VSSLRGRVQDLQQENTKLDHRVNERTVELMQVIGDLQDEAVHNRELEARLRRELNLTKALLDTAQVIILLLDSQGMITSFNQYMAQLTGYALDEVQGRDWFDTFLPAQDRIEARELFHEAIAGRRVRGVLYPVLARDGTMRQIEWYDKVIKDADGTRIGLLRTGIDVTDSREQQHQLTLLGMAVSSLGEGVIITDADLEPPGPKIVFINQAITSMSGYSAEELIGTTPRVFQESATDRKTLDHLKTELKAGRSVRIELVNYRKDGQPFDIEQFIEPLKNNEGQLANFVSIQRDIAARKINERAVHDREERLRAVLDTAVDAIITINRRGIITQANPTTERMFGYSKAEMIGQNVNMLMPSPYHEQHDGYIANFLRTGQAKIIGSRREASGLRKDGSTFPIELAVSQIDHLQEFTGIIHDISERKEMERHMDETRVDERRQLSQEIHDGVGGSLTGVGILAKTLQLKLEAQHSPEAKLAHELTQHIRDAHLQLRAISRGLMPVDVLPNGLVPALRCLAADVDKASKTACEFKVSGEIHIEPIDHANHLYRIAQEAVSNAVRHAGATKIIISLQAQGPLITLTIQDNGVGIQESTDVGAGMGLRTMRYRANRIGAILQLVQNSHGGTAVQCLYQTRQSS